LAFGWLGILYSLGGYILPGILADHGFFEGFLWFWGFGKFN